MAGRSLVEDRPQI